MMNILDLQNKLKGFSQEQLVQEMQAPTGQLPQFLVLSEITRRQKMQTDLESRQGSDEATVAQDAIAAAGVPAGFAGQMAGAMAPQTDMQGNTGAMPAEQPQMMPQEAAPVPGMAGGGIVALRDGGRAEAPTRPRSGNTFVRNGMVYVVNDQGEEVLWGPSPDAIGVGGNIGPYSSRLGDAVETEGRLPTDISSGANIGPYSSPLGDAVPEELAPLPVWGGASPEPFRPADPAPASAQAPQPLPQVPRPPPQTPLSPAEPPARDEGIVALPGEMAGFQRVVQDSELLQSQDEVSRQMSAARRQEQRNTRLREMADQATSPQERAALMAQVVDLDAQQNTGTPLQLDEIILPSSPQEGLAPTPGDGAADPATEDALAPVDPQAVAEAEALAAAQATAAQPSGGGIASVAGAAGAAPTDFEQELLDMLAAREKRAEQDKWLTLAQFGLQLMSSDAGTLGGAIGEAGAPALDALRSSRETAEGDRLGLLTALEQHRMGQAELALRRQAAAARSAAGRGGVMEMPDPTAFGVSTDENRQMEVFLRLAESAEPATQLAGQQGVDELVRRIQMRSNMPVGGSGRVPLN